MIDKTLAELKSIAAELGITVAGDKRLKSTWISALAQTQCNDLLQNDDYAVKNAESTETVVKDFIASPEAEEPPTEPLPFPPKNDEEQRGQNVTNVFEGRLISIKENGDIFYYDSPDWKKFRALQDESLRKTLQRLRNKLLLEQKREERRNSKYLADEPTMRFRGYPIWLDISGNHITRIRYASVYAPPGYPNCLTRKVDWEMFPDEDSRESLNRLLRLYLKMPDLSERWRAEKTIKINIFDFTLPTFGEWVDDVRSKYLQAYAEKPNFCTADFNEFRLNCTPITTAPRPP